jgi:hypothetical protein
MKYKIHDEVQKKKKLFMHKLDEKQKHACHYKQLHVQG